MSDTQQRIEVKEAIKIAKKYVADIFKDDRVRNVGLEEVAFNDQLNYWEITIGFSRPWDTGAVAAPQLNYLFPDSSPRTYKLVQIAADTGKIVKISHRAV